MPRAMSYGHLRLEAGKEVGNVQPTMSVSIKHPYSDTVILVLNECSHLALSEDSCEYARTGETWWEWQKVG